MTTLPHPAPARAPHSLRPLDVIAWGATGFTGKLVARYLAEQHPPRDGGLRWALAGRSQAKLERLRSELLGTDESAARVPILVGDGNDRGSLDAIVSQTRAIASTVGPFARYGSTLVAACAAAGTHYCDITGEVLWVKSMIEAHHAEAQRTGARIVPFCGFDSIPFDLGWRFVSERVERDHGRTPSEIRAVIGPMRGGASGGTIATMLDGLNLIKNPQARATLANGNALVPPSGPQPVRVRDVRGPGYDPDLGVHTAPFFMATVNTRVVRRSHALLGHPYGLDHRYTESQASGRGLKGRATANLLSLGMGAFVGAAMLPGVPRLLVGRVLPKPGEGPSPAQQAAGFFVVRFVAVARCAPGESPLIRIGRVEAQGDPGYAVTSRMLAESAICLATEAESLPERAGVLTPASGIGLPLVRRLDAAGVHFTMEEASG